MSTPEIVDNLKRHIFYHGTQPEAVERIMLEGFRVHWKTDASDGGRAYPSSEGSLGTGIYITCDWRMALFFGDALLQVALKPGTRILDASEKPDPAVLSYLQKEFGREILTHPPQKSLPRNKQLTLEELIALFRYHYQEVRMVAEKDIHRKTFPWSRSKKRVKHNRLLEKFRSILVRYGFHGYGNPGDDHGIVILADDRVLIKDLIAVVPSDQWSASDGLKSYDSIEEIRRLWGKDGTSRVGDWPKKS